MCVVHSRLLANLHAVGVAKPEVCMNNRYQFLIPVAQRRRTIGLQYMQYTRFVKC